MKKGIIGIIPDVCDIKRTMKLAEEYGAVFEYNDFMLPQQLDQTDECRKKVDFYRKLDRDRSEDTLHGAFLDITVHSQDAMIREISRKRIYQSLRIAEDLEIRGVVFHTELIANYHSPSYRERWLEKNTEFWSRALEDFPGLEIYMENMFDEDEKSMAELGRVMESNKRFGICLDYAHAAVFGTDIPLDCWVRELAPYIRHMHINDNDLKDDLHLPVGQGKIDWQQFHDLTERYQINASILLEINGYQAQKESLEYIRENHIL